MAALLSVIGLFSLMALLYFAKLNLKKLAYRRKSTPNPQKRAP